MSKKYELIPSDREGLYRVKALRDFNDVKKGDIGGYVEGEKTLSQLGDCWIYDNAIVSDNAQVCNNARVYDNAKVYGNAEVCDNVQIFDNAFVLDNVQVWDNARVCGKAIVCDNARIRGNAIVRDNARVLVNARVFDNAIIRDNAVVRGDARIFDNVIVRDNVIIGGEVDICGDAIISSDRDYIVFKNWWSSGRYFTWTRSNNMWTVGCFYGTGEELIAKAYKDSEEKGREYEKIVRYAEGENKHYTQSLEKTWKPTQKQLDAIELAKTFVTDDFGENPTLTDTLNELLEQLKKLTGEDI